MDKSGEWTVPERKCIYEPVIQGHASFAIDYSVPYFMRIPVFDAYKLEPRTSLHPFGNQEVGHKSFITGDNLSAMSFLSKFLGATLDPLIISPHDNLMRAMAFASEHKVEPSESFDNNHYSKDFSYQPWS
eukprot:16432047-Heterocapsa_arctica.AAC.2